MSHDKHAMRVTQDRFWAKQHIARIEKLIRVREKFKFAEKKAKTDDRPLLEQLESATVGVRAKRRKTRDEISDMLFLEDKS